MKCPLKAAQVELHPIEKVAEPFHTIHISGKLSGTSAQKKYMFIAIDAFTKFVILRYANCKSQESALEQLKEAIFLFGEQRRIIVDGDGAFLSQYKTYCESYAIELHQAAESRADQMDRLNVLCVPLKTLENIFGNFTICNPLHKNEVKRKITDAAPYRKKGMCKT